MSDQTTQPQNQQPTQNLNLTSPENREPDPPCCTLPPPDPGPST
jgi:hypothetical protein